MIRLHEGLQSICLVSINKDWWQALTSLQVTCIGAGNTCWLHGIYSWQMRSYKDNYRREGIRVANARPKVIIFCKSRWDLVTLQWFYAVRAFRRRMFCTVNRISCCEWFTEKDVAEEFSLYYSSSSKILKTSSILNIIVSIYEGERTSYSKYEKVIWSEVL